MSELSNRYEQVKLRIKTATQQVKGQVSPVLLAVSKKHGVDKIKALAAAGQRDFGESYVQEGIEKISQLKDLSLVWHFIGPIQSNKAKQIAEHFDWVHSVDRLKVLKLLNQHRPDDLPPLNLLLQLKVGDEESKSGASYDELFELAKFANALNHVVLKGVMCIPPPSEDFSEQCSYFKQAKKVFEDLSAQYSQVDTLSMGMSGDLEAAIQTGSTVVRIGTDLFGPRPN